MDKPRGRYSVKQYLREMENDGKLKRVMNVREYFYVVAEEEGGEVVSDTEQQNAEYASDRAHSRFACERSEMSG